MASSAQDKQPKYPAYGTYFSPPEVPLNDAFSNSQSPMKQPIATTSNHKRLPSMSSFFQTLSPPISPHTKLDKEPGYKDVAVSGGAVKDPVLFPPVAQSGVPASHASGSLFDGTLREQRFTVDPIEEHMRKRRRTGADEHNPTRADYQLTLSSLTKLINSYTSGPEQYFSDRLEELDDYVARGARHGGRKRSAVLQQPEFTTIVKKARTARKAPVEKLPPVKRVRASPREKLQMSFDVEAPFEPERRNSTTAARKQSRELKETKEHKEDADFSSLPDYSPPMSSLTDNAKALKTEWRGNPLDLSQDPHKHLLHPAELALAATLRLSCAMFICTKRRIFAARREYFQEGRDFNKTAAQQACKIDVNKASKLWTAFDKVGWFDKKWVV